MAHIREVLNFRNPTMSSLHYLMGEGLHMIDLDCLEISRSGTPLMIDEWKFGDTPVYPMQHRALSKLAAALDIPYVVTNYYDKTLQTRCGQCDNVCFGDPLPMEFAVHAKNHQAQTLLSKLYNKPRVVDHYFWCKDHLSVRMSILAYKALKMFVHDIKVDTSSKEDKDRLMARYKPVNPVELEPEAIDIESLIRNA